MKNYTLRIDFSEKKGRHLISESWLCRGEKALSKTLVDALDIPKTPTGTAKEPDFDAIKRTFGAEGPYARREFARQKRGFGAYRSVVENLAEGAAFVTAPVDANLRVTVSAG